MTDLPEHWCYSHNGPDSSPIHFRNIKGTHGRVTVERAEAGSNRRVIKMDGLTLEIPLGLTEELHAAVSSSLRPYAGFSIFQHIMMLLDRDLAELMELKEVENDFEEGDEEEFLRLQGRCAALCEALAMVRDTRNPDAEYEKARAMERWEASE